MRTEWETRRRSSAACCPSSTRLYRRLLRWQKNTSRWVKHTGSTNKVQTLTPASSCPNHNCDEEEVNKGNETFLSWLQYYRTFVPEELIKQAVKRKTFDLWAPDWCFVLLQYPLLGPPSTRLATALSSGSCQCQAAALQLSVHLQELETVGLGTKQQQEHEAYIVSLIFNLAFHCFLASCP